MNTILHILAITLFIGWIIGFFLFALGQIIHLLLILAVISIIIRIARGNRKN